MMGDVATHGAVAHARSSSSIRYLRTASSGVTRGTRLGLSAGDGVTGSNADAAAHRLSDASMLAVLSRRFGMAPQLAVRRGG